MGTIDLMLLIDNESKHLYYNKIAGNFAWIRRYTNDKEQHDPHELIPMWDEDTNDVEFLTFKEIDHEDLMRFYVRECVYDKTIRKTLFGILSRRDFVMPFVEKLKELGLYEDYVSVNGEVYDQRFIEWAKKNELSFW